MHDAELGAKPATSAGQQSKFRGACMFNRLLPNPRLFGPRLFSALLFGALLAITIAVPLVTTVVIGPDGHIAIARAYPGAFTAIGTTLARSIADTSALLTIGALASSLFVGRSTWAKSSSHRVLETVEWFETALLRRSAVVWLLASASLILLEAGDSNGIAVGNLSNPDVLEFALGSGDYPRAWLVSTLAAAVCVVVSWMALRWVTHLLALAVAVVGALAPVVVGQVLVGPDHDFGSDAAIYQTILANIAFGIIVVLSMRLAAGRPIPRPGRRRWRLIAGVSLAGVAVAEAVILVFKLAGTPPFAGATGWFGVYRFAALGVVALGLWRCYPRDASDRRQVRRGWLFLAATGVASYVAIGTAMTRVPPPQFFVETSISEIFLGFSLPDPPSMGVLFSQWRPNILFGVASGCAITGYLWAVARLKRRGVSWPIQRTIAWTIGWTIVLAVTSSGFGKYSGADFAVHMGVHMTLNMIAPIFLVLGGPVTLALRTFSAHDSTGSAAGPREWITAVMSSRFASAIYHPLLVFALYIGSYYALYFSGAFGNLMKFHWAHQLMNLHFLIVGCLYFGLIVGVDQVPRKLPHVGKLGFILAAMPFHAFFGVILMSSSTIVGENFYEKLDQPWRGDLAETQYTAGGVAWAGGEIPLVIVIVVLAIQWAIDDSKDARRIDRRLDSRADNELAAYNEMLKRIESRSGKSEPITRAPVTQDDRS